MFCFHSQSLWFSVVVSATMAMPPAAAQHAAQDSKFPLQGLVGSIADETVQVRGSLLNSFHRFSADKVGHVAFLGGSITEMNGYRPMVEEWLTQRFPETQFTFTNAGIASTCSHTGAFRLNRDVLSHGPVDLLLVEFAVNDDQDAHHSAADCIRGMEGIVRHLRETSPKSDAIMIHFVNPEMLATAQAGKTQLSVEQHEKVARHYGVSSINLPAELANRIAAGTMTWDSFGGTHPGPVGNRMAADLVIQVLADGWSHAKTSEVPTDHPVPSQSLLESSFSHGEFLSPDLVKPSKGWQHGIPEWDSIEGSKRERFLGKPLFYTTQPDSELSLNFAGRAIGAYILAGPDAGQLEVRIDDGDWTTIELYHHYSAGLHYPRTVMFASDLPRGEHQVTVRLSRTHHPSSKGTAARILDFAVNR
jgi:lysophospholipase L1-like esterase